MNWCFNETDHDKNWIVGWHWHYKRFDVFGFLIRGFWARWQQATRARFSNFRPVFAIFCNNMQFHVFWRLSKNIWAEFWQCELCRVITRVHVPCAKSCALIQRMITKIGLQVGIGIAHDLTFSDFWSEASEPVGSDQREHCLVISGLFGYFLHFNAISRILGSL